MNFRSEASRYILNEETEKQKKPYNIDKEKTFVRPPSTFGSSISLGEQENK